MDNVTRLLMQGAAGAAGGATYVDDVFNTYLWKGTAGSQTINNGIDLAGEGGLVWTKVRSIGDNHALMDSARKTGTYYDEISSSGTYAQQTSRNWGISSLNNNGFTLGGSNNQFNSSGATYASWTYRKSKGFFDIVTYTGNATTRTISHSLGSVPGLILIKDLTSAHDWVVYHKSMGNESFGKLNTTNSFWTGNDIWNSTSPTSSNFTIKGNNSFTNTNGNSYVAYVFAGGNGTTDKAVEFDGTNDYLTVASSSDLTMGTGDFTVECWLTKDAQTHKGVWHISNSTTGLDTNYGQTIALGYQSGVWQIYAGNSYQNSASYPIVPNKWYHAAYVRSGGTARLYINGEQVISMSDTVNYANTYMAIGGYYSTGYLHNGKISNLRVVKGQALYTSNFNVPHDPYTTISHGANSGNVKLLCCNGSTTTASTVTPATITATGYPTVTTNNSIFDDTKANVFGEGGDQNIIKTGSYIGNGSATGPDVYLGWEPSFIILKNAEKSENWLMWDSMRGIVTGGDDARLFPNLSTAESTIANFIDVTPTGFQINDNGGDLNEPNDSIIYIAIRRSDGYVGKPAEAGTDAFALARGAGNPSFPCFVTGFPVDFLLQREFATADSWITGARLTGTEYMYTNANNAGAGTNYNWGSNTGAVLDRASSYQGWLWKRGAGFDVVTYSGNGVSGRQMPHGLSKSPEMMWVKRRNSNDDWIIYHKGLNGGTNPEDYYMVLNSTAAETNNVNRWNDTAPTSTNFILGNDGTVNSGGTTRYIAMLFASVDEISNVGYYTGNGSTGQTITLGFQPRFVIIRRTNTGAHWLVLDTTRGWGAGDDKYLLLNASNGQGDYEVGAPTSNGFTLVGDNDYNNNNQPYIYYAHA